MDERERMIFEITEQVHQSQLRRMHEGRLYKRERVLKDAQVREIIAEYQRKAQGGVISWERESPGRLALVGRKVDELVEISSPRTEKMLRRHLEKIVRQLTHTRNLSEEQKRVGTENMHRGRLEKTRVRLPDERINQIVAEYQSMTTRGKLTWEEPEVGKLKLTRTHGEEILTRVIPRTEKALHEHLGYLARTDGRNWK